MDEIFVSHSSKDKPFVYELERVLNNQGFDAWIDQADLRAGEEFPEGIMDGIKNCKYFLVVVTPNAARSRWVPKEVAIAFDRQKMIIPLRVVDADLPPSMELRLADLHWADFRRSFDEGARALIQTLGRKIAPPPPPPPQWQNIPGRWYVEFANQAGLMGNGIFEFWGNGFYRSDLTSNFWGRGFAQGTWFFQPPSQLFINGNMPNGMPVGAVFNFTNMTQMLMQSYIPDGTQYIWRRQA